MLNVITESNTVNIQAIIELVREQHPERQDVIVGLQNTVRGKWTSKGYYQFVHSSNANDYDEAIVIEQDSKGDIIIDLLKAGRIGGIEFMDLIEQ
jgi:hypothetical protein